MTYAPSDTEADQPRQRQPSARLLPPAVIDMLEFV